MDIVQRNFFRIIKSGAFEDKDTLEPISPFKWRKLYKLVLSQNVLIPFAKGVNNYTQDKNLSLPIDLINEVKTKLIENKNTVNNRKINNKLIINFFRQRKYKSIVYKEKHSIDTSIETLNVLYLIIFNMNKMINSGLYFEGIIELGQFLRAKGQKVDFVKLEKWIYTLSLKRITQLQGYILITMFQFAPEELPFIHKETKRSKRHKNHTIAKLLKDNAKKQRLKEKKLSLVYNNNTIIKNIKYTYHYFYYAHIETIFNFFYNIIKNIVDIEE